MSNRRARIDSYNKFRDSCEKSFQTLADSSKSHRHLEALFNLNICPKGRDGGLNDKQIEIFYGNRPIGVSTTMGNNFQRVKRTEIAHGATLSYERTDDGHIICYLFPAASENQRPIEDFILLDYIKKPDQLTKIHKKHWKFFIAYMEGTCIDGNPNFYQRIQTFYLRNFKQYAKDSVVQQRKSVSLVKEVLKYTLTIGLSGFLLLALTMMKERIDDDAHQAQVLEKETQVRLMVSEVKLVVDNMSKQINQTNELLNNISKGGNESQSIFLDINKNIINSKIKLSSINKKLVEIENKIDDAARLNKKGNSNSIK
jgi:hypothetical protein